MLKNVVSKHYGLFKLLITLDSVPDYVFAQEIAHHLSLLKIELRHYFPDVTYTECIANLFSVNPTKMLIEAGEQ